MRISRIFVEQPLVSGQQIQISHPRAHYITHVLRLKPGDRLSVFNGLGGEFSASILSIARNRVTILPETFDPINRQSSLDVELGLAITKNDAMDTAIQKATELGVMSIQPLICSRTPVRHRQLASKLDHWRKIVISACEQCGLNLAPVVNPVLPLEQWFPVAADLCLIASPGARGSIATIEGVHEQVAIAIGPEGGFTSDEINLASASNFLAINIGPRIQRSDTAAATMIAIAQSRWGDF